MTMISKKGKGYLTKVSTTAHVKKNIMLHVNGLEWIVTTNFEQWASKNKQINMKSFCFPVDLGNGN